MPRRELVSTKCPVEETGRNSVIPSTTPRIIASNGVMLRIVPCKKKALVLKEDVGKFKNGIKERILDDLTKKCQYAIM
jgi:hypothetical protein